VIGGFYVIIGKHHCIFTCIGNKKNVVVLNLVDFHNSPNHQTKFYAKFSSCTVASYNAMLCMPILGWFGSMSSRYFLRNILSEIESGAFWSWGNNCHSKHHFKTHLAHSKITTLSTNSADLVFFQKKGHLPLWLSHGSTPTVYILSMNQTSKSVVAPIWMRWTIILSLKHL